MFDSKPLVLVLENVTSSSVSENTDFRVVSTRQLLLSERTKSYSWLKTHLVCTDSTEFVSCFGIVRCCHFWKEVVGAGRVCLFRATSFVWSVVGQTVPAKQNTLKKPGGWKTVLLRFSKPTHWQPVLYVFSVQVYYRLHIFGQTRCALLFCNLGEPPGVLAQNT